jgi:hypothetical protein
MYERTDGHIFLEMAHSSEDVLLAIDMHGLHLEHAGANLVTPNKTNSNSNESRSSAPAIFATVFGMTFEKLAEGVSIESVPEWHVPESLVLRKWGWAQLKPFLNGSSSAGLSQQIHNHTLSNLNLLRTAVTEMPGTGASNITGLLNEILDHHKRRLFGGLASLIPGCKNSNLCRNGVGVAEAGAGIALMVGGAVVEAGTMGAATPGVIAEEALAAELVAAGTAELGAGEAIGVVSEVATGGSWAASLTDLGYLAESFTEATEMTGQLQAIGGGLLCLMGEDDAQGKWKTSVAAGCTIAGIVDLVMSFRTMNRYDYFDLARNDALRSLAKIRYFMRTKGMVMTPGLRNQLLKSIIKGLQLRRRWAGAGFMVTALEIWGILKKAGLR